MNKNEFRIELEKLINRFSIENGSNTPDFILAEYLTQCLDNFEKTMLQREVWHGVDVKPRQTQLNPPVGKVPF